MGLKESGISVRELLLHAGNPMPTDERSQTGFVGVQAP
jgi:hypothetical protein